MTLVTELEQQVEAVKETERPTRRPLDPTLIISAITILAILVLWTIASNARLVSPVFLPSPLTVLKSAGNLVTSGFVDSTLAQHTLASLGRIFGALAAAIVIGVPAGLAIATSRIGKGIL